LTNENNCIRIIGFQDKTKFYREYDLWFTLSCGCVLRYRSGYSEGFKNLLLPVNKETCGDRHLHTIDWFTRIIRRDVKFIIGEPPIDRKGIEKILEKALYWEVKYFEERREFEQNYKKDKKPVGGHGEKEKNEP
jgi:hypothetical protein